MADHALTVMPVGPLESRLLALMSALRLANLRCLDLQVAWRKDAQCDCEFADLFRADISLLSPAEFEARPHVSRCATDFHLRELAPLPVAGDIGILADTVFLDDEEFRSLPDHIGQEIDSLAAMFWALKPVESLVEEADAQAKEVDLASRFALIAPAAGQSFAYFPQGGPDARVWSKVARFVHGKFDLNPGIVLSEQLPLLDALRADTGIGYWPPAGPGSGSFLVRERLKHLVCLAQSDCVLSVAGDPAAYLCSLLGQQRYCRIRGLTSDHQGVFVEFGQNRAIRPYWPPEKVMVPLS